MRLLFLGDVVGRAGRDAVLTKVAALREEWSLDFVIVNGENATAGFGLSGAHASDLLDAGVDCLTLGDHAFDQKDMFTHIESETRIVRPLNFAKSVPGRGARVFEAANCSRDIVLQVLGQVFMKRPFDDPYSALDLALSRHPLGGQIQSIVVDIHCEATSEKMAVGAFCDGRASLVVGTHTHVPTGDAKILPGGTAYMTDAGMCGDYNSIIGMDKTEPLRRFVTGMPKARFTPATGPATLSGGFVETDDKSGKALRVEMIRQGGVLATSGL